MTPTFNFKSLPPTPLLIGAVVSLMGCVLLAGIVYAVAVPPSRGVAQAGPTATRRIITVTPIVTMTPTSTNTPPATPTDLPTDAPTHTAVPPTRPASTRVPPTPAPPTNTPVPPTQAYGADLGLDGLKFSLGMTTQARGETIPFFVKVHNANNYRVPFGYLGVAAQDGSGASVAFTKLKINSYLEANEYYEAHGAIKIRVVGEFNTYFVICVSANDDTCDQPGADYRTLAPPIHVTIN